MARLSALPLVAAAALCVLASAETCFLATPTALTPLSLYYCPAQKPSSWPFAVAETFAADPPVAAGISRALAANEPEAAYETRPDVEEIPAAPAAETDALPELVNTFAEAGSEMARAGSDMARAGLSFASLGLSVGQIVATRAAQRAVEKAKTARLPTAAEIQAVAPSAEDVAEVVKQARARIPEREVVVESVRWVGERVEGTAREGFSGLEGVVRERVRWVGERVEGTAREGISGLEGVVRETLGVVEGVVKERAVKARGEAEVFAAVGKVKALEALEVLRVQSVLAKEAAAVGIENAKDFAGVASEVAARGVSVGALRSEELLLSASDIARDAQREWVTHVFPALVEFSRSGADGLSFTAVRAMMTAMKMGQKLLRFLLGVLKALVFAFSRAANIANTGLYLVGFVCGAAFLYQIYNFLSTVWSICSNGRSLFSSLRLAWRFISRNVNRAAVAFGNSMCRTSLSSDSTSSAPIAPSAPFCDTSPATPATPAPPTNHRKSLNLVPPLTTLTPAGSARLTIPTPIASKVVPSVNGGEPVRTVRRRRALGTEKAARDGASAVPMRYNLHYTTEPNGDAVEDCAPSPTRKPRPTPGAPALHPKVTLSSRLLRPKSKENVVETIDLSSP